MKLYYFAFPGRAEAARLIMTLGKIPFEVGPCWLSQLLVEFLNQPHGIMTDTSGPSAPPDSR
jgi:hypothetical protein